MSDDLAQLAEQDLMTELDQVERAIARTDAFSRRVDDTGRIEIRVSRQLLALAEREHAVVDALRRRRQLAAATSGAGRMSSQG